MADTPIDGIKQAAEYAMSYTRSLADIETGVTSLNSVYKDFAVVVDNANQSIDDFVKSLGSEDQIGKFNLVTAAFTALTKQTEHFKSLASGGLNINFQSNFQSYTGQLNQLKSVMSTGLGNITNDKDGAGLNMLKGFASTLENIGALKKGVFKVDPGEGGFAAAKKMISEALGNMSEAMAQAFDTQQNLKLSLYETAAAGGVLNQTFMDAKGLETMEGLAENLSVQLQSAVRETNINVEVLASLQKALYAAIPKSVTEQASSFGDILAQMSLSGRSSVKIIEELTHSFERYGKTQEESLEISARYSEAQQATGMKVSFVAGYLDSVSESFKNLGENSRGAASIFASLGKSLVDSNVPQEQATEIVKGYTSAIANLTTAQKAFLSQQTGGAGGLMGAFQIEKDLREGKIDKIFDRLQKSLRKQFGGHIITLDEAVVSPKAAAQYQKQIAIMTSGAMGQLVNKDQAKAAIDVMAKGGSGKAVQDTITDSTTVAFRANQIAKGTELRRSTQTAVSQARSEYEAMQLAAATQTSKTFRPALKGLDEAGRNTEQNTARDEFIGATNIYQNSQKQLQQSFVSSANGFADTMKGAFKDISRSFTETIQRAYTPTTTANQGLIKAAPSSSPQTVGAPGNTTIQRVSLKFDPGELRIIMPDGQAATVAVSANTK